MDREKFNMDFIYSELNNRNYYQEIVYNKCECDVINIFRGTTPKFIFTLPNSITIDDILNVELVFTQNDEIIIAKKLGDFTTSNNQLTITLTQEDTLKLKGNLPLYYQIKVLLNDESVITSDIITNMVYNSLSESVLTNE